MRKVSKVITAAVVFASPVLAQQRQDPFEQTPQQQQSQRQEPRAAAGRPNVAPTRASMGDVMAAGRGASLLRASMAVRPPVTQQDEAVDPAAVASPGAYSFYYVPPPQPRLLRKHNLVTIIVRQESEFKSEGTTDLKKEAAIKAAINDFVKFQLKNIEIEGGAITGPTPAIDLTGSRNYKGEATVERTDKFTARIQAEIIDVKPNGNLVLVGQTSIMTDDEEQAFVIAGTARAEDVTADNTVLSTQLADLDVRKTHKGAVRDNTRRGFLPRLLDRINPF